MGQRMLELLFTSSYMAQQTIYPLIAFLLVRESLEHGANASTVDGLTSFGAILCGAFGRLLRGREMAKAVALLLENPVNRRMESRACFLVQGAILHWTTPLQGTLTPLLSGYQAGLEIGEWLAALVHLGALFRVALLLTTITQVTSRVPDIAS